MRSNEMLWQAQYQASLFPPKYKKVMLASLSMDGVQLAQATLPETPTADDTAATDDVQITQAIRDQAIALNNNPVKIYNWVRNNIAFIPSYGSIQGSDMTLMNKRGNAFDTASLLIALYRSAGIPARYVYGTIDVPASKVMNWVGGVTKPEAAMSLLSQGGIPCTGITSGGTIQTIRMEHVWVEAYVDYTPSRGAINKSPNTWVPMDASFKQYDSVSPNNITNVLGVNQNAYQQSFLQSAVIDTNGDRLSGGNSVALGNQIESYQQKAIGWANTIGLPQAVDMLTGKRFIHVLSPSILLGSLPYKVVTQASIFQSIPANLRWTITLGYFVSETDIAYDNAVFTKTIGLSTISNQKLGLTYVPATAADAATLQNLQSQNATSLPAYLINGIPTLKLDNATLASGGTDTFGTSRIVVVTITDPQAQNTLSSNYNITVGDETVFSVNAAGITQAVLDDRFAKVASNTASENLQTAGTNFWVLHDLGDQLAATAHNVVALRLPSVGAFGAPLMTQYFFGIPRSGYYLNHYADVKQSKLAATTQDGQVPIAFMRQIGLQASNFEGLTFDMTFNRGIGSGRSATRLLKLTLASGGSVYKITAANQTLLSLLSIPEDVKTDVLNAIATGKEAFVPDRELSNGGWQGMGYILIDPVDGSGAYLLNGGYNGGSDDPGCSAQPVTAPAAQPVEKPSMGLWGILALAILVILAWPDVLAVAITMAVMGLAVSTEVAAAPGPEGLPSNLNQIWESTFGNAYGRFPSGPSYPGDGATNQCGSQLAAMEEEKNQLCNGGQNPMECNGNDCAQVTQQKISNRNACMAKRLEIMFTCWNGGNAGHWEQIKGHLKGLKNCQGCLARASNQCSP